MHFKIIHANQFGFQKKSGALSATSTVVDLIQTKLDEASKMIACCVFIDLCKAFDTIPHALLLDILTNYGFRGNLNRLLREYLSDRMQYVDIGDSYSNNTRNHNPFALPQGSNLGPLLFLIYINGIFELKLNGTLILFADDATLMYFDTDINNIQEKIQEDLNTIGSWLSFRKLTLNANKTKYMLVKSGQSIHAPNFNISIANTNLARVSSFKYLGITLQENLKWNLHIDSICRKIMGISCIMNRLGGKIHNTARISLYYSMVNSHLSYLIPVWGTTTNLMDIARLQIVQNHAICKFFSYDYNQLNLSSAVIKQKYKIMNIQQLMHYNMLIMSYKIERGLMKTNYRINTTANHLYATRNRLQPRLTAFRTNTGKNSIFRHCIERYISLEQSIRNARTLHSFKNKLKSSFYT